MLRPSRLLLIGLALVVLVGTVSAFAFVSRKKPKSFAWSAYRAYETSLITALSENNFSQEFAGPEDLERLRHEFAFLSKAATQEETVLGLITWLNANIAGRESMSVRAVDIFEGKAAACEVHALAVGALESLGIKARWISGVQMSLGFGLLEAFVDGKWQLYKLRDPEHVKVGKSAWELFNESEPGLNIRSFYVKPAQDVRGWRGRVYPALFPFSNVKRHREVETIFTTDHGIGVDRKHFNPYDFEYTWSGAADSSWIGEKSSASRFESEYRATAWRSNKLLLDLGFVRFYELWPLDNGLPSPFEIRMMIP